MIDARYRVIESIGQGGGGSVYRCEELELGRTVAVKFLSEDCIASTEQRDRFEREAKILCSIEHANVATFFRAGTHDNKFPYFAMEYINGKSLQAIIVEQGQIDWRLVARYALQMCYALSAIHQNGIIHRDIKPDNFMVSSSGELKLVDFGIARASGLATMTETGLLLGTVYYMSPEACIGKQIDSRADIYSLGCSLYFALFGRPPFDADTPLAIIHQHATMTPVIPSKPAIPKSLAEIILKCLSKNPDDRYQSAQELAALVQEVLESPGVDYTPEVQPKKKPVIAVSAAVIITALLCLAMPKFFSNSSVEIRPSRAIPNSLPKIPKKLRDLETLNAVSEVKDHHNLNETEKCELFRAYLAKNTTNHHIRGELFSLLAAFSHDKPAYQFECWQHAVAELRQYLQGDTGCNADTFDSYNTLLKSLMTLGLFADCEKEYERYKKSQQPMLQASVGKKIVERDFIAQLHAYSGRMRLGEIEEEQACSMLENKNQFVKMSFTKQAQQNELAYPTSEASGVKLAQQTARLGLIMAMQGKMEGAKACAKKALIQIETRRVGQAGYLRGLGDILARMDLAAAEQAYRTLMKDAEFKNALYVRFNLAQILAYQNKLTEAEELLRDVEMHMPKSLFNRICLLRLQIDIDQRKNFDNTKKMQELIKLCAEPQDRFSATDSWLLLARQFSKKGARTDSHACLKALVSELKSFHYSPVVEDTLEFLVDQDEPELILNLCSSTKAAPGSQFQMLLLLYGAQAYAMQKDLPNALKALARVRNLLADNGAIMPTVAAKLEMLEAQMGQADDASAIAHLLKAESIYQGNGLIVYRDHSKNLELLTARYKAVKDDVAAETSYRQKLAQVLHLQRALPDAGLSLFSMTF